MINLKKIARMPALIILLAAVTSCVTTASSTIGEGRLALSPQVDRFYQDYLNLPEPLAFAVSTDGKHSGWYYCQLEEACLGDAPEFKAISYCEKKSKGAPCKVYAVGKNVVWKGKVSIGGAYAEKRDHPVKDGKISKTGSEGTGIGGKFASPPPRKPEPPAQTDLAETQAAAEPEPEAETVQEPEEPQTAAIPDIDFGNYHALVIGINSYRHLPRLKTARKDALEVAKVLRKEYGFKVKMLLDSSRKRIVDALDEYQEKLDDNDNLLIYYAGHGWLDEDTSRGYWLPSNAQRNRRSHWLSNATITDALKALQAKHVMIVADSCYSGSLSRSAKIGIRTKNYWERMALKRTRVVLTSGGLEPVADSAGSNHSPFAMAFIDALKENETVLDGTALFNQMRRPVMLKADQTPEYSDLRYAGHDGGDFLFVKRKR